ncbi:hypothetical protein INP51_06290 [Blautia liquoris]|jgi:hypothetical protein|uniref:Uncharacterized protein n=1 Tax=Blautia liquoris TaxID=2779518 RepID=A0A7M2RJW6_9FIRM|nr:hypothetical protein [Blautia liquoris]QOV20549.1 hypothetical protein INP51_06290 [Blautia liquoris]
MTREEKIAVIMQHIADEVHEIPRYEEQRWKLTIANALKDIERGPESSHPQDQKTKTITSIIGYNEAFYNGE